MFGMVHNNLGELWITNHNYNLQHNVNFNVDEIKVTYERPLNFPFQHKWLARLKQKGLWTLKIYKNSSVIVRIKYL
jgi:hypothetical protein